MSNLSLPQEQTFDTAQAMTAALADQIVALVKGAVAERGAASLVLSGGSTPQPLYDRLAGMAAPWDQTFATLSDERWADESDPRSNARMLRQRLLRDRAAHLRFTPLKTAQAEPERAEADVDAKVRALPRPFDLVLLGMGEDGHAASMFPEATGLAAALDTSDPALARAVRPKSNDPDALPRMTLTLRALLEARRIVLLIEGDKKRAVYQQALAGDDVAAMPVRAVLKQGRAPVEVWWAP